MHRHGWLQKQFAHGAYNRNAKKVAQCAPKLLLNKFEQAQKDLLDSR
jgi:hypothetical protein